MDLDYRVELDTYSGPLDLLLYLVRRHEIDLNDIPIAHLTDQYLEHLELIKDVNMDMAGEFLVMASTLLEIKSAMLLPRQAEEGEGESGPGPTMDPRYELVQQLLEYKQIKDVALDLEDRREQWAQRYALRPSKHSGGDDLTFNEPVEFDLEDVDILDLCKAFTRILDSIGDSSSAHEVIHDDTPITLHAEDILDRLRRDGPMTLQAMFVGRKKRTDLIGLFLATLELVRQRQLLVRQDHTTGVIQLELRPQVDPEHDELQSDSVDRWRDPKTGQVDYEWPSDEARQRAAARMSRRLERIKTLKQSGEAGKPGGGGNHVGQDTDESDPG